MLVKQSGNLFRLHHVVVPDLKRLLRHQRIGRGPYGEGRCVDDSVLQSVGFVPSMVFERRCLIGLMN